MHDTSEATRRSRSHPDANAAAASAAARTVSSRLGARAAAPPGRPGVALPEYRNPKEMTHCNEGAQPPGADPAAAAAAASADVLPAPPPRGDEGSVGWIHRPPLMTAPGAIRVTGSGVPRPPPGGERSDEEYAASDAPMVSAVLVPQDGQGEIIAVATPLRLPGWVKALVAALILVVAGLTLGLLLGIRDGDEEEVRQESPTPQQCLKEWCKLEGCCHLDWWDGEELIYSSYCQEWRGVCEYKEEGPGLPTPQTCLSHGCSVDGCCDLDWWENGQLKYGTYCEEDESKCEYQKNETPPPTLQQCLATKCEVDGCCSLDWWDDGKLTHGAQCKKRGNECEYSADEPGTPTPFTRTSSYVRSVCSARSLATSDGARKCEEACSEVACCDPYGPAPCLDDSLESCVAYCRCHALDDDVIGPAPDDLPELCSPDRLAAGDRAACEAACAPVGCCFAEHEYDRCQVRNFLRCLDYAPCQNLRTSTRLPPAPPDLDEICALGAGDGGRAECKEICSAAACCLPGFAGDSCLHNDLVSCFTYASCEGLALPPICMTIPCAPDNINEVCSLDNVFEPSESRYRCVEECSVASCCGALDGTNCFLQDPFACAEYAICVLLLVTGGNVPRAPPNLGDTCSVENLRPQGGGRDCALACEEALCCIALPEYNCLDDGNLLACAEYAIPCANLLYEGGNLPNPPEDIAAVCSWSNVQTEKGCRECKTLCGTAACCASLRDDNCLVGNVETCAEWVLGPCLAYGSC